MSSQPPPYRCPNTIDVEQGLTDAELTIKEFLRGLLTKTQEIDAKTAEKLTHLRSDLGLTQRELAQRAGISTALMSYIERGERTLTPDVATALAEALSAAVEERDAIHAAVCNAVHATMERPHLKRLRVEGGFES